MFKLNESGAALSLVFMVTKSQNRFEKMVFIRELPIFLVYQLSISMIKNQNYPLVNVALTM